MNKSLDGILLVDKPKEWTSHDVCAFVRRRFSIKKVGHAGTLDPLATGLLVLLLGRATKSSQALSGNDKVYEGVMELGVQTDSHDRQGQVTATGSWEAISLEMIQEKAESFRGEILQVPPMVSALKHKGVRLYKLAREGVQVEREGRPVTVHELEFLGKDGAFVTFKTSVSKGTYVRTLVSDLGDALGCYAALADLRRTRSGDYDIKDALTIDELKEISREPLAAKVFPIPLTAVSHGNCH